jgi:hypothetical protein
MTILLKAIYSSTQSLSKFWWHSAQK